MFQAMKDYWWLILIRGIVAVIFGVSRADESGD